MPETANLSIFSEINNEWDVMADLQYTGWSSIQQCNGLPRLGRHPIVESGLEFPQHVARCGGIQLPLHRQMGVPRWRCLRSNADQLHQSHAGVAGRRPDVAGIRRALSLQPQLVGAISPMRMNSCKAPASTRTAAVRLPTGWSMVRTTCLSTSSACRSSTVLISGGGSLRHRHAAGPAPCGVMFCRALATEPGESDAAASAEIGSAHGGRCHRFG